MEGVAKALGRGCKRGFSEAGLWYTLAEMPRSCRSLAKLRVLLKVMVESRRLVMDSPMLSLYDMAGEFTAVLEELLPLLPQDSDGKPELEEKRESA